MLVLPLDIKIFIASECVHMGKSIDGLAMLVQSELKQDPFSRHLFVFRNKSHDKVKILYWDRNGFCVWYKRLEGGKFLFPKEIKETYVIRATDLGLLLEGINFAKTNCLLSKRYRAVC
jgi:transposase